MESTIGWIEHGADTSRHEHVIAEALSDWQADRHIWQTEQPATAFLAHQLHIESVAASTVATAATDGARLYVNPIWSAGLDAPTRRFVQAHLVWHCVAGHFVPPHAKDERRWHLACDHEVNTQLLMLGFSLPDEAVLFPACVGKPVPVVYAWLGDNPLIDTERSLDAPPWTNLVSDQRAPDAVDASHAWHVQRWQHLGRRLIDRHLASPFLPASVATWLVECW
ncbi:DUF2201 family putative metallopeptidase [Halomonas ventosae]|uniref:Putative metallopeptidase-like protein n=1 Tax=Halomonas ventosae TaxID=229007 RepID=A0A2T0VRT7_9GAMM|nr:hypothetical protein [Halomonas ventosae]PRY73211.1 putative metallopeptidase-like protein [Halomonas ventosae]